MLCPQAQAGSAASGSRDLSAVNGGKGSAPATPTRDAAQTSTAVSKLEAAVRQHREEATAQAAAAERASSQLAALQVSAHSRVVVFCIHVSGGHSLSRVQIPRSDARSAL